MAMANDTVTPLRDEDEQSPNYRLAPHNIEAEQALLGALMVNNDVYDRISNFLETQHFYEGVHGRIFDLIGSMLTKGHAVTPVTLKTYLESDPALKEIGGAGVYLARLAASAVNTSIAVDFARTISDLATRRELIQIGDEMTDVAYDSPHELPPSEQIVMAEQSLYNLAERGNVDGGLQNFQTSLTDAINIASAAHSRDGSLAGISTGLRDLDEKLGGLHPSDLIILAARPAMGKSSLALNIAFNIARTHETSIDDNGQKKTTNGGVVAFFSLEMSAEQLANRILSDRAEMPSDKIRRGNLTDDQFQKVVIASQELEQIPLFIDDTGALPMSTLAARARRLKRQQGLDLLIVDYLQLLRPPTSTSRRQDNRVQELSEITQGLKALAKELEVPILALSQLSRAVENRDDKRPQLADLRESGSIEQDSDVVAFIYRESYYLERLKPHEEDPEFLEWQEKATRAHGRTEVIIGKQRHGPIGTIELQFTPEFTRFSDLAQEDHYPEFRG